MTIDSYQAEKKGHDIMLHVFWQHSKGKNREYELKEALYEQSHNGSIGFSTMLKPSH